MEIYAVIAQAILSFAIDVRPSRRLLSSPFALLMATGLSGRSFRQWLLSDIEHNKLLAQDYAYSVGVLEPDYILELWDPTPENRAYVTRLGYSELPNGMFVLRSR